MLGTVEQMGKKELNIREKMVLFWHNHFAISDINDPTFYILNIATRFVNFPSGTLENL